MTLAQPDVPFPAPESPTGADPPASNPGALALGLLLGVGTGLVVQVLSSLLGEGSLVPSGFNGPDPYMRLNRVLECRGGPACPGGLYPRSNAPFGEVLHWPFLVDWLLMALSAPFRASVGEAGAVEIAGRLFGPLLQVGAVAAVLLAARPLCRGREWVLAGVFLSCQLWVVLAFAPDRPDHHGLQVWLFLVAVAAGIGLLVRGPHRGAAIVLGGAAGLGLWVSVEGLVTVTVPFVVLGLRWVREGGRPWARVNAWVAASCVGVLALGLSLDGPTSGTWAIEYDRFSVVHGVTFLGVAAFWLATAAIVPGRSGAARLGWCVLGAGALTALLVPAFPGLPRGPLADVNPLIVPIWLDRVAEYVTLPEAGAGVLVLGVGSAVIGVVAGAAAFREADSGRRWAWGLVVGGLIWFAFLGSVQGTRWSYYMQVLAPIPLSWLAGRVFRLRRLRRRPFLRAAANVGIVVTLAIGVPLGVALARAGPGGGAPRVPVRAGDPPGRSAATCPPSELARLTAALPPVPPGTAILATLWWGPEILYRTDLAVIATPYHRNDEGILASYDVMRATDEGEVLRRLRDRGVGLIALCPGERWGPILEPVPPGSLYDRLRRGAAPDFLRPVPLPDSLARRFGVWRVEVREW